MLAIMTTIAIISLFDIKPAEFGQRIDIDGVIQNAI
jgi:hypothetical protein